MRLHCTKCAYLTNSEAEAITHVSENPGHTVTGPGRIEGSTVTISVEEH